MINPSMTIETVHGLKETVSLSNFIVGPPSSKKEESTDHETRERNESSDRNKSQR
ncbi:hypothetical protein LF1_26360 [Rubripirellula obstinata]|uniref:Uncharacterized protein n=1 Tax=Rubripirellula obstinata TaxID=406547 RepID=A0A5B1CFX1_9BACT|nr:hypothetical protein [Rubripirellula obstinata]KAA1260097.1 hypothetical protein LF1_26360 [Rubripirellula obstinata]